MKNLFRPKYRVVCYKIGNIGREFYFLERRICFMWFDLKNRTACRDKEDAIERCDYLNRPAEDLVTKTVVYP
jgi:hypothetical protein